jgi:hypothetical protein
MSRTKRYTVEIRSGDWGRDMRMVRTSRVKARILARRAIFACDPYSIYQGVDVCGPGGRDEMPHLKAAHRWNLRHGAW